jgi:hypothetical protein
VVDISRMKLLVLDAQFCLNAEITYLVLCMAVTKAWRFDSEHDNASILFVRLIMFLKLSPSMLTPFFFFAGKHVDTLTGQSQHQVLEGQSLGDNHRSTTMLLAFH